MSVRSGILVVLTLGPAYGLQLHTEIEARTARAKPINVGQIYSTLTRLVQAQLVAPVERDDQNQLPRYELTPGGAAEARSWIALPSAGEPDWEEMVEHVLLVVSLPGMDPSPLIAGYREIWARHRSKADSSPVPSDGLSLAAAGADRLLSSAALAWLDDMLASLDSEGIPARPLSNERPRRGRRPLVVN